ncbi:hypothetical protein ACQJBY_053155 [Aegilops geniculata]
MDALGPDIHPLFLQLLSGQDNASKAQPPFFHPTPTPPPQPPGSSYVAAAHGPVDGFVYGLVPGAGNGTLAPGEGSPMLGHSAFLENDQFVDGLEDPLALMRMSGDELSAFLSDEAGVNSLFMPPGLLARSLAACQTAMADSPPVPPAGVPSRSSSGSPGLGCAQARATDSPPGGVEEPLTRMSQSSSGSPGLGAQGRATDSPPGGVEDQLTRMSGDDLTALMSDEAAVNPLCVPPEYPMRSLVVYQPAMADSPPVHPATVPSQSSSGSPGLGCAQVRATDSPVDGAYYPQVPNYPQAASLDGTQQEPDSETAEVAQMARVAARCGDKPSTAWSAEEDQLLFRGLSRFAGQDNVIQCLNIASGLAEKTALDVAYRIRWLSDLKSLSLWQKKEAAKQAQLGQEKSAVANVTKGKGTKVANKKNNEHPLSKETLGSRSAKDIIRDTNRLMDKIEEILRTGESKGPGLCHVRTRGR